MLTCYFFSFAHCIRNFVKYCLFNFNNGYEFHRIFNEDKTKSQRLIDKELKDERNKRNNMLQNLEGRHLGDTEDGTGKYYWAIRSGALKKIPVEPYIIDTLPQHLIIKLTYIYIYFKLTL